MSSVRDVILLGVIVFALGIGFFILHYMSGEVITRMVAVPAINASADAVTAIQGGNAVRAQMDYVIVGVFVGLVLGILITGWFVGGNPLFMFAYFLLIVVGVVVSVILANTWETASAATIFGSTLNSFPITNNILLNLPIYTAVVGFLGIVVMFGKPLIAGGGEGGDGFY